MNTRQLIEDDINKYYLDRFLERCCRGLNTDIDELKANLFTNENLLDISAGLIPEGTLRAHIETWIADGKLKIN